METFLLQKSREQNSLFLGVTDINFSVAGHLQIVLYPKN